MMLADFIEGVIDGLVVFGTLSLVVLLLVALTNWRFSL